MIRLALLVELASLDDRAFDAAVAAAELSPRLATVFAFLREVLKRTDLVLRGGFIRDFLADLPFKDVDLGFLGGTLMGDARALLAVSDRATPASRQKASES